MRQKENKKKMKRERKKEERKRVKRVVVLCYIRVEREHWNRESRVARELTSDVEMSSGAVP